MTIKKIIYTSRNDFRALFQCEKCGYEFEAWGYSDANYFDNVIPNALCPVCGLNSQGENFNQQLKRLGRTYAI